MKIKNLIFFDWDDTLSDFKTGIIPDSAISALQTLNQQANTVVAVASGRAAFFFQNKVKDFRLDAMVCTNGQYASLNGKVIYESFAKAEDRDRLIEVLKPFGGSVMGIHSELGIKMYLYPTNPEILNHDSYQSLSTYGPSIESIDKVHILLAGYPEAADAAVQAALPQYQCHRYNGYMVDIIPKNASKLAGIEVIAQHLGLELKDVYAFGDSHNDYQMIEGVGMGIALGNAKEEIKAIAQYVTTDLQDDGVYKALVHLGLLKEN